MTPHYAVSWIITTENDVGIIFSAPSFFLHAIKIREYTFLYKTFHIYIVFALDDVTVNVTYQLTSINNGFPVLCLRWIPKKPASNFPFLLICPTCSGT
jgi:hypothetical protein